MICLNMAVNALALIVSPRRTATVRAKTQCDMFVLQRGDFKRILREQPQFAAAVQRVAKERYNLAMPEEHLIGPTG